MSTEQETQTFEQKVTSIVNSASMDDKGNLVLPEGIELDEATVYAVKTEKRRRDTQAAYTKSQQQIKQLTSAQEEAFTHLENELQVELTTEEQTELEELKVTNPDAWRKKLNQFESRKKEKVGEIKKKITEKTSRETALEERAASLAKYNEENPDYPLSDDVIDNDIPPRFTKQLASNEITFDEFLTKCRDYLAKGKTLDKGTKAENEVDLSQANGSAKLSDSVINKSSSSDYKKETY
jgi:hypothetical protein